MQTKNISPDFYILKDQCLSHPNIGQFLINNKIISEDKSCHYCMAKHRNENIIDRVERDRDLTELLNNSLICDKCKRWHKFIQLERKKIEAAINLVDDQIVIIRNEHPENFKQLKEVGNKLDYLNNQLIVSWILEKNGVKVCPIYDAFKCANNQTFTVKRYLPYDWSHPRLNKEYVYPKLIKFLQDFEQLNYLCYTLNSNTFRLNDQDMFINEVKNASIMYNGQHLTYPSLYHCLSNSGISVEKRDNCFVFNEPIKSHRVFDLDAFLYACQNNQIHKDICHTIQNYLYLIYFYLHYPGFEQDPTFLARFNNLWLVDEREQALNMLLALKGQYSLASVIQLLSHFSLKCGVLNLV